jgi:hypothetical protein
MTSPQQDHPMARELWLYRLSQGRPGKLTVRSGSMAPLLQLGEEIEIVPPPPRFWPADLIVFAEGERLICHRIMLPWAPGRYLQKGDLNREWETVRKKDIVGVPSRLITPTGAFPLRGGPFRWQNSLLWLLVGARDLARLGCRLVPRLSWTCERLFSHPILAIIRRIRQPGGDVHDPSRSEPSAPAE